jgi:uncharacterized RDD family membrane protein YckC
MPDDKRGRDEVLADLKRFDLTTQTNKDPRFKKPASYKKAGPKSLSGSYSAADFDLEPAGFARRGLAFMIDLILIALIFEALLISSLGPLVTSLLSSSFFAPGPIALLSIATLVIGGMLFFGFSLSFIDRLLGGTPGKALLGIRVVDYSSGDPAGFLQYLFRETIGKALSSALFLLGYVLAFFQIEGRALHDLLCKTRVKTTIEELSPARWFSAAIIGIVLIGGAFAYRQDHAQSVSKIDLKPLTAQELQRRIRNSMGRAVVVNLWSPYCGPCRQQFPHFLSLKKKYENEGLDLIYVAVDDDSAENQLKRSLARFGVDFTSYFRNEDFESFANEIDPNWSGAIPFTVTFDSNRRVIYSKSGFLSASAFEDLIQKALKF